MEIGVRFKEVEAVFVAREICSHDHLPIFPVGLVELSLDEVGPHGSGMLEEVKEMPNTATFGIGIAHGLEVTGGPMTRGADDHRLVVVLL